MRDYSEKRLGRDMSERRPAAKNRPRRESGGLMFVLALFSLAAAYGAGVLTGWFVFKGHKPPAVAVAQPVKKQEAAPAPEPPRPAAPLTFYKTLPAGSKAAMGTGLNLKKPEGPAHHDAPPQAPAAPTPAGAEPASAPAAAPATPAPDAAAAKPESAARFVVQVASYRDKQEAAAAQAKLSGKGLPAYLVESRVADKGVWYRLRVGRHLTKAEADEMAAKSGKGAIVVPE